MHSRVDGRNWISHVVVRSFPNAWRTALASLGVIVLMWLVPVSQAQAAGFLSTSLSTTDNLANQHTGVNMSAELLGGVKSMESIRFNLPPSLKLNARVGCEPSTVWGDSPLTDCPAESIMGTAEFKSPNFEQPILATAIYAQSQHSSVTGFHIVAKDASRGIDFRISLSGAWNYFSPPVQFTLSSPSFGESGPYELGGLMHSSVPPISGFSLNITGSSEGRLFRFATSDVCAESEAGSVHVSTNEPPWL